MIIESHLVTTTGERIPYEVNVPAPKLWYVDELPFYVFQELSPEKQELYIAYHKNKNND